MRIRNLFVGLTLVGMFACTDESFSEKGVSFASSQRSIEPILPPSDFKVEKDANSPALSSSKKAILSWAYNESLATTIGFSIKRTRGEEIVLYTVASGLTFVDETLEQNVDYTYEVRAFLKSDPVNVSEASSQTFKWIVSAAAADPLQTAPIEGAPTI